MPETEFTVTRVHPRFSFVAEAEVTWQKDQTRVVARICELSARGCYVDTMNPFPLDAELHVHIRYGCSSCEVTGMVIYSHSGYGMGVRFGEIAPSHRATLDSWLDELRQKSA
jgi:PilZ domain